MKTKIHITKIIIALFLIGGALNSYSQVPEYSGTIDDFYVDFDYQPKNTWGISAGLSYSDRDDNNRTTFCLGTEYLTRINTPEDRGDCGLYLGGSASYHYSTKDEFNKSVFKVGPKVQFHTPINYAGDTQLITGLKAAYLFGTEENFGNKDDLTGYGVSLTSGLNLRLSARWTIGVEFPVISYSSTTLKSQEFDVEITEDRFSIAINKRNPLMAYSRFTLGGRAD